MKNIKLYQKNISQLFLMLIVALSLVSCENEFSNPAESFTQAPPIITSISEAREDKVVTQGVLENVYIIRGENLASLVSISFNGLPASFNAALLTDKIAFVEVPKDAPFLNQNNKIVLENLFGSTSFDFSLLTITGFTEGTANGKKVVNLLGGDFTDASSVTFVSGTEATGLDEKPADFTVLSSGEIQAEVPAGVEQAFIFVSTSRGATASSDSYGFNYSIYIDTLNPEWTTSEWGGTHDLASTEVALGNFSIKSVREGWAGLTFTPSVKFDFDEYEFITFSIYGTGAADDSVNLAINDFAAQLPVKLVPNEWTKVVIKLSDFYPNGGLPDVITRLDFQESSGTGLPQYIFYIDDFGFL